MPKHARTFTRREAARMPDGSIEPVLVRYVRFSDGTEVAVDVALCDATEAQHEGPCFRTLFPKKRRNKAPANAPANVVGKVKLSQRDLRGAQRREDAHKAQRNG
jgi:hypothetical protein